MKWTNEQLQVIETDKKNMLVSAAAGSGKTAVLVQRIISQVLDEKHPIDVDRILVVTFTNAAAQEMKERVRKAIDKAVVENPMRNDIKKQAVLIHNAQIRTIDSFCNWVVKNYFYEIDLDPGFRIASAGELDLLSDTVLSEVISQKLEASDEEFKLLADTFIEGLKTGKLKEMVYEAYRKAMSMPWPNEWFDSAVRFYQATTLEEYKLLPFIEIIAQETSKMALEHLNALDKALELIAEAADTKPYSQLLMEKNIIENIANATSFDDICAIVAGADFPRFVTTSFKKFVSEDVIEHVKNTRNAAKDFVLGLAQKGYFSQSLEESFLVYELICVQAKAFIQLVRDYSEALFEVKQKKAIYDFNDIEHLALKILRNPDSPEHEKSQVACELSELFIHVMVDEYQDSNDLQESILSSICKGDNYFTVGDVKQSIYGFRQASPKLFMDKFESYNGAKADSVRIDLDQNFRSRSEVLDFCNQVFEPLMRKDIGNVEYDEKAKLKLGATYYPENGNNDTAEILIGEWDSAKAKEYQISSKDSFEAWIVAERIKQLINEGFKVTDKDPDNPDKLLLRPMKYSDVVILLRSSKSHANEFIKVFRENEIPAFVEEEQGFFERDEIQTILAMLEVIDNPYNEIPLAAVMHSYIGGFSTEELAKIRCASSGASLYESLLNYQINNPTDAKINNFMDILSGFRDKVYDTPIHEMISAIVNDTGYGIHVSSLPMSNTALANINKLIDEALNFEGTSYKGVSKFVSYINDLKRYDEELGIAKTIGQNENAITIMTIHKSKGLEFPVVFLCRCGQDVYSSQNKLNYHDSTGVTFLYKNPRTRIKRPFWLDTYSNEKVREDALGEEQRILYVALTRAKEKLIVVGNISSTSKNSVADIVESYNKASLDNRISYYDKNSSGSYLEWILRALFISSNQKYYRIISMDDIVFGEAIRENNKQVIKQQLKNFVNSITGNYCEKLCERLNFKYTDTVASNFKNKYSVSEIKHYAMEQLYEKDEDAKEEFSFEKNDSIIPMFVKKEIISANQENSVNVGALYGSAMHRFLECFDFSEDNFSESFSEQLRYLKECKLLTDEEYSLINKSKLITFLKSPLAKRMHEAAQKDALFKEQPFVYGDLPGRLFENGEQRPLEEHLDEMVLVQGIIDVFFKEGDSIVLMDYKTDRVDDANELVLRYQKQLLLYKEAIERAYHLPVKEMIIYSFCLGQEIQIF